MSMASDLERATAGRVRWTVTVITFGICHVSPRGRCLWCGPIREEVAVLTHASIFSEYRPLLFTIAYEILGTVVDTEDVLQDKLPSMGRCRTQRDQRSA